MHDCPECGMACDCDGEDTWNETPANCEHCDGCQDDSEEDPYEPMDFSDCFYEPSAWERFTYQVKKFWRRLKGGLSW